MRALVAALLLAGLAAPAGAARVVDVRVGLHKSFTRVVFETDAPARYRIDRSPTTGEIEVHLDAAAQSRRVSTRSKVLREVRVVPGQDASVARLRLRGGGEVKVQELILLDPPRIVLDLRPIQQGSSTLKADKPSAAEPKAAPKPAAKPPARKPAPSPETLAAAEAARQEAARIDAARIAREQQAREDQLAAERKAAAEAARRKAAAEAAEREAHQAAQAAQAARQAARKEQDRIRAAEAELDRAAAELLGEEPAEAASERAARQLEQMAEAGEPGDASALAEADVPQPAEPGMDDAQERSAAEQTARALEVARSVPPTPTPRPAPSRTPAEPPASTPSGISGFLSDPIVLGGIGLAIALAIGIVIHQRRSGREDDFVSPVHDDEPFSIEEGAVEDEAESSAGDAGESEHVPVPDVASGDASAQDEEAGAVNTEIGMDSMDTGFSPGVAGGANADLMRMVQELERRLTVVEKKLEETTEAKERLERQVAAQTEELRVQRSAIARTQRALRSIARPEEEATEPVPKG